MSTCTVGSRFVLLCHQAFEYFSDPARFVRRIRAASNTDNVYTGERSIETLYVAWSSTLVVHASNASTMFVLLRFPCRQSVLKERLVIVWCLLKSNVQLEMSTQVAPVRRHSKLHAGRAQGTHHHAGRAPHRPRRPRPSPVLDGPAPLRLATGPI